MNEKTEKKEIGYDKVQKQSKEEPSRNRADSDRPDDAAAGHNHMFCDVYETACTRFQILRAQNLQGEGCDLCRRLQDDAYGGWLDPGIRQEKLRFCLDERRVSELHQE